MLRKIENYVKYFKNREIISKNYNGEKELEVLKIEILTQSHVFILLLHGVTMRNGILHLSSWEKGKCKMKNYK